ncbi:MAG: cadherin domain-containing protein, partial [Candidatus Poribacteria bacterium]|nr:cadherin domain-containing protein [Candidatus Poribacteria bacterium]
DLDGNQLSTLPSGIFDNLTQLIWLGLINNQLSTLPAGIFDNLTQRMALSLSGNQLSTLPAGIFKNMAQLTRLDLDGNQLSALPDSIFAGLTELTYLWLQGNAVDPLPLPVSLEAVGNGAFKAVASTGAPFDIVLPLIVSNGSLTTGATTVTIHKGRVESEVLTVNRTPGTSGAVTVNIGVLPGIPTDTDAVYNFRHHQGYALVKSGTLPLVIISGVVDPPSPIDDPPPPINNPPVFTEGVSTTRAIAENTAADVDIGSAVSATDAEGDTLTYTLSGTDAAAFRIVSTTGQLRTWAVLDYETKSVYTVAITASDGSLTDTISVTITVTDVVEDPTNRAPVFTEGVSTTRAIAENTAADVDIGS